MVHKTQMTHDSAMKLIRHFSLSGQYSAGKVMEFINLKGGVSYLKDNIEELIEYSDLIKEAEIWLKEDREKILREISKLGQELQPEDYKTFDIE